MEQKVGKEEKLTKIDESNKNNKRARQSYQ